MNWEHITVKMQAIVHQKMENGTDSMPMVIMNTDPILLRQAVVRRMLRCVDTLTLQCIALDYNPRLVGETDSALHQANTIRSKIMDPALNIRQLGEMLQQARKLETDLMQMLSARSSDLLSGHDFVAEREVIWQLDF
jgi:hypothetical protein